jgi:hypothetical protein
LSETNGQAGGKQRGRETPFLRKWKRLYATTLGCGVCSGPTSSHARRINDHDAGAEPRELGEVRPVERQQMRHPVGVADRHKPGVMNLLANDAKRFNKKLSMPGK